MPYSTKGRRTRAVPQRDASVLSVSAMGVLSIAAAIVALFAVYGGSYKRFIPILDHANLAFHEAGHVFFGFLGSTLGLYGGTLGQLVFPVLDTISTFARLAQVRQPRGSDLITKARVVFVNEARFGFRGRVCPCA